MYLSSGMTTYDTMTMSEPHGFAVDLLTLKLGIYSRVVKHIDIEFHWTNKKPVKGFSRGQAKDFHQSLMQLPRVRFDKRNRRIHVDVVSSNFFAEQQDKRPSKSDLKYGNAEYLDALRLVKEQVKFDHRSFDIDQFIREATRILNADIPNAAERNTIAERSREWSNVALANHWPFQDLVDNPDYWNLFHPNARSLLVTPIFWTKELGGPHGTEVGADVLREFARWHISRRRTSPLKFLAALLKGWSVEPIGGKVPEHGLPVTTAAKTVLRWHQSDPNLLKATDQIAIGLAFAVYKLRGRCPEEMIKLALAATKRRRLLVEKELIQTSMPFWDSNLKMLDIALKKMDSVDEIPNTANRLLAMQNKLAPPTLSPIDQLRRIKFATELEYCYDDLKPLLERELDKLRIAFLKLPANASKSKKLQCVKKCVISLNALEDDESVENGIDTDEREILCDLIYRMGDLVGLDPENDYVDQWREW